MMSDDELSDAELDAFAQASARALGLSIAPEWREAVRANLRVSLRMAGLVGALPLPDEAEPAPVFEA
jgi:hypothetical protein